MNYTKGEWIKADKGSVDDKNGYPIAIVFPDTRLPSPNSIAKREANANLIAAAPDMYEVLKEVRDFFVEYRRVTEDKAPWPILNKMGKAIAKAEGRE